MRFLKNLFKRKEQELVEEPFVESELSKILAEEISKLYYKCAIWKFDYSHFCMTSYEVDSILVSLSKKKLHGLVINVAGTNYCRTEKSDYAIVCLINDACTITCNL